MTVTAWEITIPNWHPAKVNELYAGHWGRRKRLKDADAEIIGALARQAEIPRATGKRRVGLVIVLGPRQRAGDNDAYHKSLLDGLKRAGLIVDDNRQWCEITPVVFVRGERKGTVIRLEDVT